MINNSNDFIKFNRKNIYAIKPRYNIDNWIAFDLEWEEDVNTENNANNFSGYKSLVKNASGGSVPPDLPEIVHRHIIYISYMNHKTR